MILYVNMMCMLWAMSIYGNGCYDYCLPQTMNRRLWLQALWPSTK